MKEKLLIILILFGFTGFAQYSETDLAQATTDIKKISENFDKKNKEFTEKEKELNKFIAEISTNSDPAKANELSEKLIEVQKEKNELNNIYLLFENYKKVYLDKGIPEKTIDDLFNHEYSVSESAISDSKGTVEEPKTFLYFGKDQVLEESKLTNNKEVNDILKTILKQESESYLGDIIIPKENQRFEFYNEKFENAGKFYKFKRITFEIQEGFFADIKVFVFDGSGSELLFENRIPVSILRYSNHAPKNFLVFKHFINQNGIVSFDDTKDLKIRLSDVLMYVSRPGYNFIPNDITFDFPTKKENGDFLNKDSSVKYEIKEDTSLQNVVEFRAYTDFLGLFADSPNGIVQLQGKGDFYVVPFLLYKSPIDFRILDKISPYVNFSRIDEDLRGVETVVLSNSNLGIKNSLDLLQKAYLEMGTKINLVNFKFAKELPFRTIVYFPIRYQISDIKIDEAFKSIQGLGIGGGVTFEFKRFNNFGFNYSLEYSKYSYMNYNKIPNFDSPAAFNVFRNEAEVYYHPGKEKKQAIFLKFRTFNNSDTNEAFYQLQFGYRFSIGISDVKAKTQ